jgi:hypothetical protein
LELPAWSVRLLGTAHWKSLPAAGLACCGNGYRFGKRHGKPFSQISEKPA